jgi:Holliday junction resolvase
MVHYKASGSKFERELKGILENDPSTLLSVTKTFTEVQKAVLNRIKDISFIVIRSAGSLGVDLFAINGHISFPIEIKSSDNEKLNFSSSGGKGMKQAEEFIRKCTQVGLIPLYAFRIKGGRGDPWRIFTLPSSHPLQNSAYADFIYRHLPKIDLTAQGNFQMVWSRGMPLHEFIDRLHNLMIKKTGFVPSVNNYL